VRMPAEGLGKTRLASSLADVLADISDLLGKQIQLAKSELMANLGRGLSATIWILAAAFLFLLAAILLVEAAALGIASMGIAIHWACALVGVVLIVIGAGLAMYAKGAATRALVPERTIRQLNKDIDVAKEQLR
jgi:hypothetical protein